MRVHESLLVFHLSLLFHHSVLPLLLLCKEVIYKVPMRTQTHLQIIFMAVIHSTIFKSSNH